MTDLAPQSTSRRAALVFIFITVLIDVLAFGVIIPGLPHLVEQLSGGTTSTASYWIGAFGTVFTRQVGADVQGRIQGALMSLVSMAGIIGPTIFAGSFGYFVDERNPVHLPGVPFLIAALLLAIALVAARRYAKVPDVPAEPVDRAM
jgi:MFS transporter, DHA1 family, tetracycline resistance protein